MFFIKNLPSKLIHGKHRSMGLFYCGECSSEVEKRLDVGKNNVHCGCKYHGESGKMKRSSLYKLWLRIRNKCYNKNSNRYTNCGGKGIQLYKKWENKYINFRDWALNNSYTKGLQLIRIDENKDFCPDNCKFISRKVKTNFSSEVKNILKYAVDSKGCHICISHFSNGRTRPCITRNGKRKVITRYLWEKKYGEIPKGLFVCHSCDNPKCINLEHLWLGTQKENMQDAYIKGRCKHGTLRGSDNPCSKLTNFEVQEIKRLINSTTQKRLAERFNISQSTISLIKRGIYWKHIT